IDCVSGPVRSGDAFADVRIDGYTEPLLHGEELPDLPQRGFGNLRGSVIAHAKMARVGVAGRGRVLVNFFAEPFIIRARATGSSARIGHDGTVALSTAGRDNELLIGRGERRNARLPDRGRLGGYGKAGKVSGDLGELRIAQILVGDKGRHDAGTLA